MWSDGNLQRGHGEATLGFCVFQTSIDIVKKSCDGGGPIGRWWAALKLFEIGRRENVTKGVPPIHPQVCIILILARKAVFELLSNCCFVFLQSIGNDEP